MGVLKHRPNYTHDYAKEGLEKERIRKAVAYAERVLKDKEFDAIAFQGMSGALIAPIVAYNMGKTLIMVRKGKRGTHSCFEIEGDKAARKYVIVDDFISSGKTVRRIMKKVANFTWYDERDNGAELIGMVQYAHNLYYSAKALKSV